MYDNPPEESCSAMEIKKITEVNNYLDPSVEIVFFDIDNTILETETAPNLVQWVVAFENYVRSHKRMRELSEQDFFIYIQQHIVDFIEHMRPALVEDEVLGVIHAIEQRNIPIIGLTNRPLKSAEITASQLRTFGLDFSSHQFNPQEYNFEALERTALFKDGIIIGNSNNKGLLIKEFLEKIRFRPKKLLFIDDSERFVHDVEHVLRDSMIEVLGLRYGFLDEKMTEFSLSLEMIPEELR
ncbi:MAG: hypothetical protein US13_C0001G0125 [candidate division TM6 bacterium GW2011_GWE2_36_25]|nr:MAG: hypothetical protein US03_C0001G0079 [candidate division TM6 bacterium GW2011_GWF2_36_131]KKQ03785.1 MAG: hypothetical protein US13_C0001G0125 [candidate division TM6 bacterium GW2011_GWE2_36_25]KKQ19931.1 MAG: hypothetical protein US32_C0003G0048 [candidate division TM6 bacterium GW2011_GWA2_36_9]